MKIGTRRGIQYGSGQVNGFLSQDVCGVGDLTVLNQVFIEVTGVSGSFGKEYDGVLGLSYPRSSDPELTPVFDNMIAQGLLTKELFSVYLERQDSATARGSEIVFGGIDSTHYTGDITYVPVSVRNYWQFNFDGYVSNKLIYLFLLDK